MELIIALLGCYIKGIMKVMFETETYKYLQNFIKLGYLKDENLVVRTIIIQF